MPDTGVTSFDDMIKGRITMENAELDDLILLRSDEMPTYNFTVVIDDATMNMTHVIRGDDHVNNTPRQVKIYEALGFELPLFAHVPMILGPDKTKLSKRHGATSVIAYQDMGYLPEALVNYLVRLSWSHGDQEIFTLDELIEYFDIHDVGRALRYSIRKNSCGSTTTISRPATRRGLPGSSRISSRKKGISCPKRNTSRT